VILAVDLYGTAVLLEEFGNVIARGGTPDEVATVGALLMGPDGAFITGSDVLMDGGVTASYFFGELAPQ
jgi:NAD(P)-dependent dehydrogenase (short-subunit alcohol dehydrogenase family)